MDDSSKVSSQIISDLLVNKLPFIQNELAKLKKDAQQNIDKMASILPGNVNIVKMNDDKIVIEFNLKASNDNKENDFDHNSSDDSNGSNCEDKHDQNDDDSDDSDDDNNDQNSNHDHRNKSKHRDSTSADSYLNDYQSDVNSEHEPNCKSSNTSLSRRTCRSFSESDSDYPKPKGILKYPKGWKKRTFSECSLGGSQSNIDCDTDKDASGSELTESEVSNKQTKKVTFNRKVFKSVFHKNAVIVTDKSNECKSNQSRKKKSNNNMKKVKQCNIDGKNKSSSTSNTKIVDTCINSLNHSKVIQNASQNISNDGNTNSTKDSDDADCTDTDTQELDNANLVEPEDDSDWEEVKSKKNRNRRKRTDSKSSSDHSESEDLLSSKDCEFYLVKKIDLHSSRQIEVK